VTSEIVALLGHRAGTPGASVRDLVGRAMALARSAGARLCGLSLCAPAEADSLSQALAGCGIEKLYLVADPRLSPYLPETHARAVAEAVRRLSPRLLLCAHDYEGTEVAPWVAAALDLPLLSNCVALDVEGGELVAERLAFAGAWQVRLRLAWDRCAVASLGAANPQEHALAATTASVERLALDLPERRSTSLAFWSASDGDAGLTTAECVVGIGRGIGDSARLEIIEALASALGGSVGCSRPLVDLAWLPHARQIGVSGHTIRPKVYLACGISGAAQHLAGIVEAQTVIAINRDPTAPIFRVAHHGVVGDLFEIVPALTAEALRRRAATSRE